MRVVEWNDRTNDVIRDVGLRHDYGYDLDDGIESVCDEALKSCLELEVAALQDAITYGRHGALRAHSVRVVELLGGVSLSALGDGNGRFDNILFCARSPAGEHERLRDDGFLSPPPPACDEGPIASEVTACATALAVPPPRHMMRRSVMLMIWHGTVIQFFLHIHFVPVTRGRPFQE